MRFMACHDRPLYSIIKARGSKIGLLKPLDVKIVSEYLYKEQTVAEWNVDLLTLFVLELI